MKNKEQIQIPLLATRGITVFPNMIIHFDVGRKNSIQAIEKAMIDDEKILLVSQKDAKTENPTAEDLYDVGTIASIKQILKLSESTIRILVEGETRARVISFEEEDDYFLANAIVYTEPKRRKEEPSKSTSALLRVAGDLFEEYSKLNSRITTDMIYNILSVESPGSMADLMIANISLEVEKKQAILSTLGNTASQRISSAE